MSTDETTPTGAAAEPLTYVCPQRGIELPDRRKHPRGPADERIERLFNGFANLIDNQDDDYLRGFTKAMRQEFADIVRALAHPAATAVCVPSLTERLQRRCYDWGTYWRASDAHGVELSIEQAAELLRDALGVEVDIASPAASTAGATPETPETLGVSLRAGLSAPLRSTAIPDASGNGLSVNPNTEN